jgi:serine/threonine-protein kinase
VIRQIGRGGMSEVYLARDPILDRDIAVKLIAGELDGDVAQRRLVREASAAGRLRHPNIVTIFDAGIHDGHPYIAMEYVAGETLRSLIQRREPLSVRRRLELIEGACAGLAHAHGHGVVHLDIKPDNLIVDETGVVKVLDFGIARVLSGDVLATRHVVGTLRYMSPEQVADEPLDHRSDIFSLGSSLYELLTYLPAYAGSTKEIVYRIAVGPVPRLTEVIPDADPGLDAALSRAMALEPADRYADASEFGGELARVRAQLDPSGDRAVETRDVARVGQTHTATSLTPVPTLASPRTRRMSARRRTWAAVALSASTVAVAAAAVLWPRASDPPQEAARVDSVAAVPAPIAPPAAPPAAGEPERRAAAPETEPAADANEVWRRFALGDRAGVLAFLKALPAARNGGSAPGLAYDVLSLAAKSVAQSRAEATATAGAPSSESYRLAEERLGRANQLEAARNPVGALAVLWEASDLFARSAEEGRRSTPPSSPPAAAKPEPVLPAEASVSPPVSVPSSRVGVEPPQPDAPARPRAAAESPAATSTGERRTASPEDGVREALSRYRSAYQARDASAVHRIFPSLNPAQIEQIRKTFEDVAAYAIEIRDARVRVQGETATADAVVLRRMTPPAGSDISNEVETRFTLRRTDAGWIITGIMVIGPQKT